LNASRQNSRRHFCIRYYRQVFPGKAYHARRCRHLLKDRCPPLPGEDLRNDKTAYAAALRDHIRATGTEAFFSWRIRPRTGFIYSQWIGHLPAYPGTVFIDDPRIDDAGKGPDRFGSRGNPELIEDKKTGLIFKQTTGSTGRLYQLVLERAPSTCRW